MFEPSTRIERGSLKHDFYLSISVAKAFAMSYMGDVGYSSDYLLLCSKERGPHQTVLLWGFCLVGSLKARPSALAGDRLEQQDVTEVFSGWRC